ncbi:hypothetical protein B0J13DRAFT_100451 [Dactylonectria estremocensis]|uniref:BZIP transcription factor n=1 Tax=Dactylonectria estremocensis TaxID=1079267 RepID=A0A9P9E974_9HYPO|nr:hypothetical protein B0J13DRAFT_100451 [Dactylonectria estremocensis]
MSTGADSPGAAAFGIDSPAPPTPGPGAGDDSFSRAGSKREAVDDALTPGDDSASGGARKKKKMGPGSRGVANLTPEQLAKKRANDREAQRAIRERTKNQIETLERRIQDLTSQQPYQELQAIIRAKEAVEQENADIKRRLAGIVAMLQPLIGQAAVEQAYISPAQTYAPPVHNNQGALSVHNSHHHNHSHNNAASTPDSVPSPPGLDHSSSAHPHHQQHWQQQPTSAGNGVGGDAQVNTQLVQQRNDLRHGLELGPERLGLDFLLDPTQRVNRIQNGLNSAQDTPSFHHMPMKHDWTGVSSERALHNRSTSWGSQGKPSQQGLEHHQHQSHQQQQLQSQQHQYAQHQQHAVPPGPDSVCSGPSPGPSVCTPGPISTPGPMPPRSDHGVAEIKNCPPTCPLDSLLLDFLSERRQRAADGLSAHEVVGPRYPSVSSLLNPAQSAFSHPLSKVFTDILSTFPDISNLPERVAVLYIMFLLMRWQIAPTQDNYERLPEWIAPTPEQLTTPHPAWVDHIPFPPMRDRLCRDYTPVLYAFENFFIPFTTTLSLSWPYEDTDTLLQNPDGDELMINPVFERHLRNLDNWKLGNAFAKAFPTLADTFNLDSRSPVPAPGSVGSR